MNIAKTIIAVGGACATFIILSSIHPWGDVRGSKHAPEALIVGSDVPPNVRHVLESKCADCHSSNTEWPLYSEVAPASWLVERDVHEGRIQLNLSEWQRYSAETQIDLLTRIGSEARNAQMPLKQYLILHPQARLTPEEQELIYAWTKSERKQIKQKLASHPDKTSGN
jgi:cytochrome c